MNKSRIVVNVDLELWYQKSRAGQWMLRWGISPRMMRAGGVSLGIHCLLFLLVALFSGFAFSASQAQNESSADDVLEISFQAAATEEPRPEPAVALPDLAAAAPSAPPVIEGQPEPQRGIITQLDPKALKRAAEAPENASFLASHHAEAITPGATPAPSSIELQAVEFRTAAAAAGVQAEESEEGSIAALGAWNKAVANAIGARWDHYRRTKGDLLQPGSVLIRFSIDAKGKVSDVHVVSNDAGSPNALYAVRSATEAEIPPIPADRLARLPGKGKRIEVKYTFTIFPNS